MKLRRLVTWIAASATLAIAACGGGGGIGGTGTGGGGNSGGGGGIGGTGVAYGTITAFGSVWVNGVEYDTSNTTFKTDDNPNGGGGQDDLRVGMVVRVDGSISGATASTITEDESLKGFVEQVIDANRMVVMGQTVQIDNTTRFDNGVVPVQGDRVEVHGLIAGDGVISAGYIEKKTTAPTPPFAVKGIVKNQDTASQTFQVGTLTVQYAGATVGDMPAGTWNGLQVDIKGSSCGGVAPVCGTLVATKVEPAGARVSSASQAEIEGVVVAVTANGFTIGNQQVVTTANTRYEGGVAGDLIVGTKVEAEGSISNGVLTATKVSFRDAVKIEGDVATVNGGTLTISGLPGVTVNVTTITELKDVTLAGLAAGQHLRIRGKLGAGNSMVATRLELRNADTDVELQAPAQAITPETSIRLLGVDISTAGVSQYRDVNDAAITRSAFFAAARVNGLIKANGSRSGATVNWNELELED
jgi:hypothetical protein